MKTLQNCENPLNARRTPLLLVQWEIGIVLRNNSQYPPNYEAWPAPDSYLSTSDVLTQFIRYLKKQGKLIQHGIHNKTSLKVVVAAHRDHFPRCRNYVLKSTWFTVVNDRKSTPQVYDPNSIQAWTRNYAAFRKHEK
eukprot:PhF_6_TR19286/c0_g1_i1/m.28352